MSGIRRRFPNLFRSADDPLVHEGGPIVFGVFGFAALFYFSVTFQFTAMGVVCVPILVAQIAWTNLLYGRVRAFSSGWPRLRTLLAAEYSLTGVLRSLYGLLLGSPYLFLLYQLDVPLNQRSLGNSAWLVVPMAIPCIYLLHGFGNVLTSVRIVAPKLFRTSHRDRVRHVRRGPK